VSDPHKFDLPPFLEDLPVEQIPAAIAMLAARLLVNGNGTHSEPQSADRLLTPKQAAGILGTSADWIYDRKDELPFVVHLPFKNGDETKSHIRCSFIGIQRWIRRKAGRGT
jgi:hypothetical protein